VPPAAAVQLVTEGERWTAPPQIKLLTGVDIFVDWSAGKPEELAAKLNQAAARTGLKLKLVTNRGVKVWPGGFPETFCTDHWCVAAAGASECNAGGWGRRRGSQPRTMCQCIVTTHAQVAQPPRPPPSFPRLAQALPLPRREV